MLMFRVVNAGVCMLLDKSGLHCFEKGIRKDNKVIVGDIEMDEETYKELLRNSYKIHKYSLTRYKMGDVTIQLKEVRSHYYVTSTSDELNILIDEATGVDNGVEFLDKISIQDIYRCFTVEERNIIFEELKELSCREAIDFIQKKAMEGVTR